MDKFSYEENGYDRKEVNQFVSSVIEETEVLLERVKKQNAEITYLKEELSKYKNSDKLLTNTIIKADEEGEKLKKIARDESEVIIKDAKQNASRIINEALLKAEKVENHTELLIKNAKIFKTKLKMAMQEQQAVIDEIDKIELDSE